MQIHQFQVSYSAEQDRILVRLNTHSGEEIRFWLTRRMMTVLFPAMERFAKESLLQSAQATAHDGTGPDALAQFRKQEVLKQTDFETPFDTSGAPLLNGNEPLLVTAVHIQPLGERGFKIRFDEVLPAADAKRSLDFNLTPEIVTSLLHVLHKVLPVTEWGLGANTPIPLADDSFETDLLAGAERPKYLN